MAFTVSSPVRHEAEPTNRSRFIATVTPVSDEAEAKEALRRVSAEMSDASHHCWAWRMATPSIERAGDDGEPSGSAGRPILAQLVGRDLVDTAVIVTRYFGGTKLGVGGLVRAYGGAAGEALDLAQLLRWVQLVEGVIVHEHGDTDSVARALEAAGAVDIHVDYQTSVTRAVRIADEQVAQLRDLLANATAGRVTLTLPTDND